MSQNNSTPLREDREWFFVFTHSERTLWWHRLFLLTSPAHMHHVLAFCQSGRSIQFAEPMCNRLDLNIALPDDKETLHAIDVASYYKRYGATVVLFRGHVDYRTAKAVSCIVPSCVSIIKIVTGFMSWAQTPMGYFKHLIRNGGKVL